MKNIESTGTGFDGLGGRRNRFLTSHVELHRLDALASFAAQPLDSDLTLAYVTGYR